MCAARILPRLYLASRPEAEAMLLNRDVPIDAIAMIGARCAVPLPPASLYASLLDAPSADLLGTLPRCILFLSGCYRAGDSVVVNCAAGQSRSAAVIAAFLMTCCDVCLEHAMELIWHRKPTINVNPGFLFQLAILDEHLRQHGRDCRSCSEEACARPPRILNPVATAHFFRAAAGRVALGRRTCGFDYEWDSLSPSHVSARRPSGWLVWDFCADGNLYPGCDTTPRPSPFSRSSRRSSSCSPSVVESISVRSAECHDVLCAASPRNNSMDWLADVCSVLAPPRVRAGPVIAESHDARHQITPTAAVSGGPALISSSGIISVPNNSPSPAAPVYCCLACGAILFLESHVIGLPGYLRTMSTLHDQQQQQQYRQERRGDAEGIPPHFAVTALPWMVHQTAAAASADAPFPIPTAEESDAPFPTSEESLVDATHASTAANCSRSKRRGVRWLEEAPDDSSLVLQRTALTPGDTASSSTSYPPLTPGDSVSSDAAPALDADLGSHVVTDAEEDASVAALRDTLSCVCLDEASLRDTLACMRAAPEHRRKATASAATTAAHLHPPTSAAATNDHSSAAVVAVEFAPRPLGDAWLASPLLTQKCGRIVCPVSAGGCGARVGGWTWDGSWFGTSNSSNSGSGSGGGNGGGVSAATAPLIFVIKTRVERRYAPYCPAVT